MLTKQQIQTQPNDAGPSHDDILRVPAEYRTVEGQSSPLREKLAMATRFLGYLGTYEAPSRRVTGALLACECIQYDVADAWWRQCNLMRSTIEQQARELHQALASQPARRELGQSVGGFVDGRYREIVTAVSLEAQDDAKRALAEVQESFDGLDGALAKGRRESAFISLTAKMDEAGFARAGMFERELRGRGIDEAFLDALQSARDAAEGDAGQFEQAKLFAVVGAAVARDELADTPHHRQYRNRMGGTKEARTDDQLAKSNILCRRVIALAEEIREMLVDPTLLLATDVRTKLLGPAARIVLGATTWDMPTSKFDGIAAGGGKLPSELEALEGWWAKNLPRARADTRDALTIERRGGARGPQGWGVKRKNKLGWERTNANDLVQDARFAGSPV